MKKLLLAVALVVAVGAGVFGASTDTLTIGVTITGAELSVDISSTSWNISLATGTYTDSDKILVTNNSGGLTEDYRIKASTTNWTLGTSLADVGPDKCVLAAVVTSTTTGSGTFEDNDVVGFEYVSCTSLIFGQEATCGDDVASGGERRLWLKFKSPTSCAIGSETITLFVEAMSP